MPTIDAAPSLAQLVHNSDKTGAQQFPLCLQPPASTTWIVSHPKLPWLLLLRSTLGPFVCQYHRFQQRAREELFPLITVAGPVIPQRQFTVHHRLRLNVPGANLSQVQLVPVRSEAMTIPAASDT